MPSGHSSLCVTMGFARNKTPLALAGRTVLAPGGSLPRTGRSSAAGPGGRAEGAATARALRGSRPTMVAPQPLEPSRRTSRHSAPAATGRTSGPRRGLSGGSRLPSTPRSQERRSRLLPRVRLAATWRAPPRRPGSQSGARLGSQARPAPPRREARQAGRQSVRPPGGLQQPLRRRDAAGPAGRRALARCAAAAARHGAGRRGERAASPPPGASEAARLRGAGLAARPPGPRQVPPGRLRAPLPAPLRGPLPAPPPGAALQPGTPHPSGAQQRGAARRSSSAPRGRGRCRGAVPLAGARALLAPELQAVPARLLGTPRPSQPGSGRVEWPKPGGERAQGRGRRYRSLRSVTGVPCRERMPNGAWGGGAAGSTGSIARLGRLGLRVSTLRLLGWEWKLSWKGRVVFACGADCPPRARAWALWAVRPQQGLGAMSVNKASGGAGAPCAKLSSRLCLQNAKRCTATLRPAALRTVFPAGVLL